MGRGGGGGRKIVEKEEQEKIRKLEQQKNMKKYSIGSTKGKKRGCRRRRKGLWKSKQKLEKASRNKIQRAFEEKLCMYASSAPMFAFSKLNGSIFAQNEVDYGGRMIALPLLMQFLLHEVRFTSFFTHIYQ